MGAKYWKTKDTAKSEAEGAHFPSIDLLLLTNKMVAGILRKGTMGARGTIGRQCASMEIVDQTNHW